MIKFSYKTRRLLALLILLFGLPLYVGLVVTLISFLGEIPVLVELFMYVFLGVAWALPTKFIFRGIGQSDPGN